MPAIDPPPPASQPYILRSLRPGPAIRRRAAVDAALISGVTIIVCVPAGDPIRALGFGVLAVVTGLVYFIVRRGNDLATLATATKERDAEMTGKGVSLADWRSGAALAPWAQRSAHPVEKRV